MTAVRQVPGLLRSAGALAVMVAASVVAFVASWSWVALLLAVSLVAMRRGRPGLVLFACVSAAFQVVLFGLFVGEGAAWRAGPVAFYTDGAQLGLVSALRLSAVLGANLAVLSWFPATAILDGLPMPRLARAFLGAVLIAVQDVRDEGMRLVQARTLEGRWPSGRVARVRAAGAMVPAILVAAERRGRIRCDALRSAGLDVGRRFAPLVAVTALALVGRIVFAAVPNVTPTFLFVFLGGLLFGARVGATAGAVAMALSDLLLSGLLPTAYVNVPAMALLGMLGGWCRPLLSDPGRTTALLAGALGAFATLVFSVAADTATWLAVPELRQAEDAWRVLVVGGLVFNILPAAANALLFAWAVGPVAVARKSAVFGSIPSTAGRPQ